MLGDGIVAPVTWHRGRGAMLTKLQVVMVMSCVLFGGACGASDPDTQTETSLNPADTVGEWDLEQEDLSIAGDVGPRSDGAQQGSDAGADVDQNGDAVILDIVDMSSADPDTTADTMPDTATTADISGDSGNADGASAEDVGDSSMISDVGAPCGPLMALLPPEAVLTEAVALEAADGKSLAATFTYSPGVVCRPGLLLLHQFTQSQQQWGDWPEKLAKLGYVVLAIDLRGHGKSDPQDGALNSLLTDPDQAPKDVAAAMDALKSHSAVDSSRVGVIGTSIGANLAVVAMVSDMGAKAVVPVSPRYSAIEALSGATNFELTNVLCLATELDSDGDQAATCDKLVSDAVGSAEKVVYSGSDHGIALLNNIPDAWEAITGWLADHL